VKPIAFVLAVAACGTPPHEPAATTTAHATGSSQPMPAERHWQVYDGDTLILEVSDRPGPILSTAPLPPGQAPMQCAFMSATSRDAFHENQLHQILEASKDLPSFLNGLVAAGFKVKPLT